jgi:hypothetical protein
MTPSPSKDEKRSITVGPAGADHITDGIADEVQFQAAIDESQGDELEQVIKEAIQHLRFLRQGVSEAIGNAIPESKAAIRTLIDREKAELLDRIDRLTTQYYNHSEHCKAVKACFAQKGLYKDPFEAFIDQCDCGVDNMHSAITAERNSLTQKADAGKEGL